jgi:cathepsin L
MKLLIVLLSVAVAAMAADPDMLRNNWAAFKKTHNKQYESIDIEVKRFNIWKANLEYITRHNLEAAAGKHTFQLGMNKFGDLTSSEFGRLFNGFNATQKLTTAKPSKVFAYNPNVQVPDSIDWRTQGYVTPVKDQGQCGSCWAFSSTGSLEGQHFKATGKLVSLSEQNLVDCSTAQGNMGCNGGLMDQAFTYIKVNNGIDTEDSYPYEAVDDTCKFSASTVGATDSGFTDIKSKDESALMQAVGTVGPVSVAIDASHTSFQFYKSGIYHERMCSATRLDHGVLAVGYGADGNNHYWIVKNSWSTSWGDQGYIKMSRNRKNNCGIATAASYPTV